ncbi:MAG TPA: prepilin-type N-terminal cleavage/methylation domain-containing protein, partial [Isosphaeraceae bacterium]
MIATSPRRGFTLVEMAAAAAILMVAMTLTVQLVGWVATERRAAEQRTRAIQEAANLMERLTAGGPGALT